MKRTSRPDLPAPWQVYKFGGSSVGTADAIRAAVQITRDAAPSVVAVVSATSGTTDLLIGAAKCALRGEEEDATRAASMFEARHLDLVRELIPREDAARELTQTIQAFTKQLRAICQSILVLRELTPRTLDGVVSRGERVLARIFAATLAQTRTACRYVDAAEVIQTTDFLGSLWPDFSRCTANATNILVPMLQRGVVPVLPGFIGSGPQGELVTLGRGGSDFSAAILARSLKAASVTLYKEMDGILTADPRWVPDARVVPELHYREAAELAYYGAKVLHPRTMAPLLEDGIPLYLRNTFNPTGHGTRVAGDVGPGTYPVRALSAFLNQALLTVEGSGMMGVPGVAARTFEALGKAGHSVSMISQASSEATICCLVPEHEADHAAAALQEAFKLEIQGRLVDAITVEKQLAAVAVVGLGMKGTPGIAARTTGALAHERINIVAMAQGSSELNITMVIRQDDVPGALQALHREYQLDRVRPLGDAPGRQASLVLLGLGQIGRALTQQLISQAPYHRDQMGISLLTVAVADRSGLRVDENGFSAAQLTELSEGKAKGAKLQYSKVPRSKDTFTLIKERVWPLPLHTPILVDVSAAETAPLFLEAVNHGMHVVTANKKPLAVSQVIYDELFERAAEKGVTIRYEATVGAGLPVLDTLSKLREAGDDVDTILGCLSGTLGYLMTQLEEGTSFSQAVSTAHAMGYTEPDPREDLSGMDVARKALILARTLGLRAELKDIEVDALFPRTASHDDPKTFLRNLEALDGDYADTVAKARRASKVLRYVARISKRGITVGMEAVPMMSPMAQLRGTDNQVVIHTRRYSTNPLVVTGPGAGADVTASGVLNDIVAIASTTSRGAGSARAMPRRRHSRGK